MLLENGYHHETFRTDGQWVWQYAIYFARWQHPAVGHRSRFDMLSTSFLLQWIINFLRDRIQCTLGIV